MARRTPVAPRAVTPDAPRPNQDAPSTRADATLSEADWSVRKESIMSMMFIAAEIGTAVVNQLGTPTEAASDDTWSRVRHAQAQGDGVVQVRCPDATATERETLARPLAQGAAAHGMAVDIWPGAGRLVVRRVVDERREDRQGPTMRTGH